MGKGNHIFPFIVEGNFPDEYYPKSLDHNILGADINRGGGCNAAFIKVISGLLKVDFHTLWNGYEREKSEKERIIREEREILFRAQSRFSSLVREIFISYSRLNLDNVKAIKNEIEMSTSANCWMDLEGIESGAQQFTQDIVDGINGSRVFLFMLSKESQNSKFALRELNFAMKKAETNKEKHVVIVNIDNCQMCDEFDFMYGLTDTIVWTNQPQKEKLLKDIARWIGNTEEDRRNKKKLKIEAEKLQHESCSPMSDIAFNVKNISFIMKPVRGGDFSMGSLPDEAGSHDDEYPHYVNLSDFYISETPVTQALWQAVMGDNPSFFKNSNGPVENVNWFECQQFIEKLNSITGRNFSLPTEAQWEYSARGGRSKRNNKFSGSNNIEDVAWFIGNSDNSSHSVKQKEPNELGLYDMSGNVSEWCNDWYDEGYYKVSPDNNPQGPEIGFTKVVRGGSWHSFKGLCRVSYRHEREPEKKRSYNGFRIVLQH